jgi:hypothetical protein
VLAIHSHKTLETHLSRRAIAYMTPVSDFVVVNKKDKAEEGRRDVQKDLSRYAPRHDGRG